MRVNIYEEELTNTVEIVETTASNTGITYYGVRVYLKSAPELHHTEVDDDRSAVTFWLGDAKHCEILAQYLRLSNLTNRYSQPTIKKEKKNA